MSDHGGGYYNVVYANGITLHLGSEGFEGPDKKTFAQQYTIESGAMKGTVISNSEVAEEEYTYDVMRQANGMKMPYVYSIASSIDSTKYYFIHIPWENVNGDVSFQDLCFKDGLTRMLSGMEGLEDVPQASNLVESYRDTGRRKLEAAKASLARFQVEQQKYDQHTSGNINRWRPRMRVPGWLSRWRSN